MARGSESFAGVWEWVRGGPTPSNARCRRPSTRPPRGSAGRAHGGRTLPGPQPGLRMPRRPN